MPQTHHIFRQELTVVMEGKGTDRSHTIYTIAFRLALIFSLAVTLSACPPSELEEPEAPEPDAAGVEVDQPPERSPGEAAETLPARAVQRLEHDAAYLAAPEREGRGLRTEGIRKAERFIAARFDMLGLKPVSAFPAREGHESAASAEQADEGVSFESEQFKHPFTVYRHDFDTDRSRMALNAEHGDIDIGSGINSAGWRGHVSGVEHGRGVEHRSRRGKEASLGTPLLHGDNMRVVPQSGVGNASGELTFAGYAIADSERDWNDFEDIDLEGQIALAFRYEPWLDEPVGPFGQMQLSRHAGFGRKAREAREAGAEALAVVAGSKHARDPEDLTPWDLVSLDPDENRFDQINSVDGMPVIHISHETGTRILEHAGYPIDEVQRALRVHGGLRERSDSPPAPPHIERIKQEGAAAVDLSRITAEITVARQEDPEPIEARNVLGFVPGEDSERTIVIGGHHDHLGNFGESEDAIYHGADDNASGVAAVLELAARFSGHVEGARSRPPHAAPRAGTESATSTESPTDLESLNRPPVNLLFMTFSAEEVGLLGSRAFVSSPEFEALNVAHMINLDMLGRNPDMPVEISTSNESDELSQAISRLASGVDREVEHIAGEVRPNSDHYPFHQAGIPVSSVFTGLHEHYHDVGDTPDKLDYEQISDIVYIVEGLIYRIAADK